MVDRFNEVGLAYSDHYAETMNRQVLPWLRARCQEKRVKGAGDKQLAVYRYDGDGPKGTVLVLHGFTENAEKFSELTFSLLRQGWSVLTYDQRGHGMSWRDEQIKDFSLTHVDHFEDYVEDLRIVCDQELAQMPKPWVIFGHSMGGAVTACFLEDHPEYFEKAVLCAPMIAPQRAGLPLWTVKAMCHGARLLGKGRGRIFISKPWNGPEEFETSCASGRERFDWYDAVRVKKDRYHNNGPTYTWTLESMNVTKRLLAPGAPERIQIPVMLYTAETDNQVIPEAQESFISRVAKGRRKVVAGAKHEIYRSPDAVFFPWWQEILSFLG